MTTVQTPNGNTPEAKPAQDDNAPLPPIAASAAPPPPPPPEPPTSTALTHVAHAPDAFKMMLEPQTFKEAQAAAAMVHAAQMFKVKSPADAMVRIMTGRALGLPMFASLKGIFSIDGAVGLEAKLKVALCNGRSDCEYFYCEERTPTKSTWVGKRRGRPKEQRLTFTIEEARAAGLLDRGDTPEKQRMNNWNRYPADMLIARASSRLADLLWPEASLGLSSKEELEDAQVIDTVGEPVPEPMPPQAAPLRDFAKECEALKQEIKASAPDGRKALRAKVETWRAEAGEPWAGEVGECYNAEAAKWRAAAKEPTGKPAAAAPDLFGKQP